ncbi:MAG: ABC transporter permease subunit [Tabrizicola sp.]|jgi:putative spermidine/putrescine transport system permease protein|nr:ABC transporter permease subunit [Tabrizicola sp.]
MTVARLQLMAGVVLAAALIAPLVPLAIWSFAHGWRFPDLMPRQYSLAAWTFALSAQSGVLSSLWTTFAIAGATTVVAAVIGLPAGRALGLYDFPGKRIVLLLLIAPALVPAIAIAPGLHAVFLHLGLSASWTGVVLAHLIPVIPYMTLILAAAFARFDPVHEDQARSLGARPWQVFRHITLPMIGPSLLIGSLFAFLVSWSQYLLTLVIGGGKVQTLPLTLYSFAAAGRNDITGAIALIYILPGVVVLIFTARRITGRHPSLARGLAP